MAPNSLAPGYVLIAYHSAYGKHNMILPTRAWSQTPITGALGSWVNWNSVPIDGEDMVTAFVTAIKAAFLATTIFDTATVYTQADENSPAFARKSIALSIAGTNSGTLQAKAVQHNWMFRDDEFSQSKLTFLDAPIGSNFDPTSDISGSPALVAIYDEWTSVDNAWSSRNGLRPSQFVKITYTLNEKLRKEYGMT